MKRNDAERNMTQRNMTCFRVNSKFLKCLAFLSMQHRDPSERGILDGTLQLNEFNNY